MPPCVQYDDLWPGGPRFARSGAGFALGTDSVLLADFAADRRVRRFADLGCGAGVRTVLLLHALPQAAAVGVELQPDAAQLCRNNLEANGLTGRAQNDDDGSVTLEVQGDPDKFISLFAMIQKSDYIQITGIRSKNIPPDPWERGFSVKGY